MLLRELYEDTTKKAVLAFGRLNPPTIGHAKLVDTIKSIEGDHYLFLSQSQKPKTDPLDFATKVKFARQFFPGINIGHQSVRTPVQALEMLQSLGYTDIVFIAGSDRVEGFQKLFDTYNGKADKSGNIPFEFKSIKVVSAGDRDPDADDVSGMSASKMRAAAASGNLKAFAKGVPNAKLAQTMYDAVRKGMGVTEPVAENVSPEDEDKFHNELDNLVHKYFGDSPDEEKMKKKMRKVKEGSPISDLKKIIGSKVYKQEYLMALKMMKLEAISAADAARRFMHVDARTLDAMAAKMGIAESNREYVLKTPQGDQVRNFDVDAALDKFDMRGEKPPSGAKKIPPASSNTKAKPAVLTKNRTQFTKTKDFGYVPSSPLPEGGEAADFDMDPEDIAKRKPVPVPSYYKDKGVKSWKQMPKLKVQDENPPRGIHKA
jgi:hypothetical protein